MPRTEPESAAVQQPKVAAVISTIESDKTYSDKVIDLKNQSDSIWLRNHLLWAVRNNAQVVVGPTI